MEPLPCKQTSAPHISPGTSRGWGLFCLWVPGPAYEAQPSPLLIAEPADIHTPRVNPELVGGGWWFIKTLCEFHMGPVRLSLCLSLWWALIQFKISAVYKPTEDSGGAFNILQKRAFSLGTHSGHLSNLLMRCRLFFPFPF